MPVIKEELISDHITIHDVLPLSFLKKSLYNGSKGGIRFRLEQAEETALETSGSSDTKRKEAASSGETKEGRKILLVSVWPEPYAYAETDPSGIIQQRFPFSNEGITEAVSWLDNQLTRYRATKELS